MKKIIYSIVTALILSIVLILLVPKWLFKGDARWTYQNDAARVDVRFNGHLRNGHVGVEGTDLKVTRPAWLSSESYQGTVIEFPASYWTKSYQIKLTPEADEWGEDAALMIELKGRDFQHRGKRRPAWVYFQNITLNGQPVVTEKVVWHDRPFLIEPPHAQEITLTFDVCKPLAISDISFKNILGVFLACLMICLFFTPPKTINGQISGSMKGKDIIKVLSDGYQHIDPIYRRSFWIIFGMLCFAFGLHAVWFMWGNHDWVLLEHKHRWLEMAWVGRYMIYSVKVPFSSGVYLPLVYDILTILTLSINAILLCKYWRLKKRVVYFVLCGLVLTAQPFTLSMLYYVNMIPEVFIGVTCVLVALLLSERIALSRGSMTKKILYSVVAIILINFSLAMYPVLLNTIAVAFVGRLLVQSFNWDGSWRITKSQFLSFVFSAINIILGIVSYKIFITYVIPIRSLYNTDTLPLEHIPERMGILFEQCFHQLYEYNMPFLPQWILWIFLGFLILLVLYICATGNFRQKIARLSLLFGALFATQTAMIIAKTHLIDGRVDLFGLVFFEVLVMVLIITHVKQMHNLSVFAGVSIIFASIINDLDCLRVWKLGFDAEKMLWNRILTRLESQQEFNINKKYRIIQIGDPISLRKRYYTGNTNTKNVQSENILWYSYDPRWDVMSTTEFYYPSHWRDTRHTRDWRKLDYLQMKRLYQAGVLQKAEVWPGPNGLIVWKDIILFVTDGKKLNDVKKRLERELGKK